VGTVWSLREMLSYVARLKGSSTHFHDYEVVETISIGQLRLSC